MDPDYADTMLDAIDLQRKADKENAAMTQSVRSNTTQYKIYTLDGDIWYTNSYTHITEGLRLDGQGVNMISFVPSNGMNRGREHRILLEHISEIVVYR